MLWSGIALTFMASGATWGPQALPDTTDDHLEPSLRPLLPPFMINNLRSVRYARGPEIAAELARRAGLRTEPSDASVTTEAFVDSITASGGSSVDLDAYLRLRLFDLFIGDWSRRPADLHWERGIHRDVWQPVAAPYRNPMPLFRGMISRAVLLASESMTDFSPEYPSADRASAGLRSLDRRLLGHLPASRWDSVTLHLQGQLVDDVARLSPGATEQDAEVSAALRRRAETLAAASEDLRRTIDRWVALHGTDGDDSVSIRIRQGHLLSVTIGPRDPLVLREELQFNSAGTRDLRIILGRGDDILAVEGPAPRIPIEVIGEATTVVLSRATASAAWRTSTPFGMTIHRVSSRPNVDERDWGRETTFEPWLDLDSDDGLFVGGGPVTTTYGFGLSPYAQRTTAMVGLASSTLGVRAQLGYEDREWWRGVRLRAGLRFAQADMTKFFGIGNETAGAASEADVRRFEGRRRDVELNGGIDLPLGSSWSAGVHARVTSSAVHADRGSVVDSLISSGAERSLNFATVCVSFGHDSRGQALLPADAVYLAATLEATPAFLQNPSAYLRASIDAQWHYALPETAAVIVSRLTAETFSGSPPWFEAAAIGGSHSLRGYERERFRGDASAIAGVEARIPAWTIPFFWKHETGVILFAETGRVFVRGQTSRRWHSSIGAGGWVRAVGSPYFASGTIARSPEDWKLSATLGFSF
jgi:hypothetical protein